MKCGYCEAVDLYQMDQGSVEVYRGRKSELKEMQQIVKAYAAALEAPPDGVLRDVSTLPYPKGRIKQALITNIRLESHRETRDHLMSAYVALGDWQDTEHADPTTVITESTALLEQLRSLGL